MVRIAAGYADGALHAGVAVWPNAHGGHKLMRVAVRPGGGDKARHRAPEPPESPESPQ